MPLNTIQFNSIIKDLESVNLDKSKKQLTHIYITLVLKLSGNLTNTQNYVLSCLVSCKKEENDVNLKY